MTDAYAVFGNPIEHSLSPQIHLAFAAQLDHSISYVKQRVEPGLFDQEASAFFANGGRGLNVTVPFKTDAYAFADQLSRAARQAGAVNTLILRQDGSVFGDNTDGVGLVRDIEQNLAWQLSGLRVLVLGAGGAVRGALGPILAAKPGEVMIANRTAAKAKQLATAFTASGEIEGCGLDELGDRRFDLVINGSSASLAGQVPDLPPTILAPGAVCYDMMYASEPTVFLRWAQGLGARACADGLGMLVEQAAQAFFIWRGCHPEAKPVIAQMRALLSRQQ